MNDLIRPSLYRAHHEILPLRKNALPPVTMDVVGPVCETGDFLARDRTMANAMPGDYLAICDRRSLRLRPEFQLQFTPARAGSVGGRRHLAHHPATGKLPGPGPRRNLVTGMSNPFGTDDMAAGYATSRPPVHPRVIAWAYQQMARTQPFERALDVGCGAGVSTRALSGFTKCCIGLEPAEAMLKWVSATAPSAEFVVGAAEAIPLRDRAVDLITAAGSLNYANLDLFFPEAARVLAPQGMLLVYDFSPGRSLRSYNQPRRMVFQFPWRYPPSANEARELSPRDPEPAELRISRTHPPTLRNRRHADARVLSELRDDRDQRRLSRAEWGTACGNQILVR